MVGRGLHACAVRARRWKRCHATPRAAATRLCTHVISSTVHTAKYLKPKPGRLPIRTLERLGELHQVLPACLQVSFQCFFLSAYFVSPHNMLVQCEHRTGPTDRPTKQTARDQKTDRPTDGWTNSAIERPTSRDR